jgi:hypothetical protein
MRNQEETRLFSIYSSVYRTEDSPLPMWLSFKEHGENGGNKSLLPSQSGAVAAKIGRQISRQNSNRSSGGR